MPFKTNYCRKNKARIYVTGRRGRRCKQLPYVLKERRKLKKTPWP